MKLDALRAWPQTQTRFAGKTAARENPTRFARSFIAYAVNFLFPARQQPWIRDESAVKIKKMD